MAIGIITYKPGKSVLERIKKTIIDGYKVYIFDNSPDISLIRDYIQREMTDPSAVTYLTCGKNVGLGYGLAAVCSHAYYDSYPTLLFFDQDTVYSTGTLQYISDFYTDNVNISDAYSALVFNSKNIDAPGSTGSVPASMPSSTKANMSADGKITDVLLAINSGSLYILKNVKKMNWHSTKYFVDCVDYEFCMSSSHYHYKIGEHSYTPGFDHCSEQGDQRFKVFGREIPMRSYPFSRIWDSYSASFKLILKAIATGNFTYFIEISKAIHKYLFVQFYVRMAAIGHRPKTQN